MNERSQRAAYLRTMPSAISEYRGTIGDGAQPVRARRRHPFLQRIPRASEKSEQDSTSDGRSASGELRNATVARRFANGQSKDARPIIGGLGAR